MESIKNMFNNFWNGIVWFFTVDAEAQKEIDKVLAEMESEEFEANAIEIVDRNGEDWTNIEEGILLKEKAAGTSYKDIAAKLHRSESSVYQKYRKITKSKAK